MNSIVVVEGLMAIESEFLPRYMMVVFVVAAPVLNYHPHRCTAACVPDSFHTNPNGVPFPGLSRGAVGPSIYWR